MASTPTPPISTDELATRNNTVVYLMIGKKRVGRVQQFSETIDNNVQAIAELGRDFTVELQKGVTEYSFTLSSFYVKADVMDDIKGGQQFSLSVAEPGENGTTQLIEYFPKCMLGTLKRSYNAGQVAIGQEATIHVVGTGVAQQPA